MKKRRIILDCDPGIDDALAIMMACRSPELIVEGITVVSGNVKAEQCYWNAKKILEIMGCEDIPVFLGESHPMSIALHTAEDTHGDDGLGGFGGLPDNSEEIQDNAVDFIVQCARKYQDELSIIAIGPLTNIAVALKTDSKALRSICELVSMGGTFLESGNVSACAEFNYWVDPDAAQLVYSQLKRPITMVGLDVTRPVVFTPDYMELLRLFHDPLADYITRILQFYVDFHWNEQHILGSVINDPVALAYFLDPTLCNGKDYYVQIATSEEARGVCLIDRRYKRPASNCHVLTEIDSQRTIRFLMKRLFPDHADVLNEIIR